MNDGCFYFISDDYFNDFPDKFLLKNKEAICGVAHGRPCFYSFQEKSTSLYWMIPISSQVKKYLIHYNDKVNKYGFCDTILFEKVLGYEKAFLIQNMFPTTKKYIINEYLKNNNSVKIPYSFEQKLHSKVVKILTLTRQGKKIIFPDVLTIEQQLLS